MRTIGILLLSLAISACTSWPGQGRGGYYHKPNPDPKFKAHTEQHARDFPKKSIIKQRYTKAKVELGKLAKHGASQCFPAQIRTATIQSNRISKELNAELYEDAYNDILMLESQMHYINRQLSDLNDTLSCQIVKKTKSKLARRT